MIRKDVERLLKDVEKPGRYTGGEQGEIIKDKSGTEEIVCAELTDEAREEKSLRLQFLLKQFIKEAVQDSNQEMYEQMRDTIMKELDYQFRNQEEREDKREENAKRVAEEIEKMVYIIDNKI